MRKIKIIVFASALLFIMALSSGNIGMDAEATTIKLLVDGNDITSLSSPLIVNDRTLVPIRFVTEEIGAEVMWDGINRTVSVVKGNKSVFLRIDSYLVEYNNGELHQLSDVAPLIINDRTYVPLRLISNAFGIGIEWDEASRTVMVDSRKTSVMESFHDVNITSLTSNQIIDGKTTITVSIGDKYKGIAKEVKLLLLDKESATGFVVSGEKQLTSSLVYIPSIEENGAKIMAVALYDENGRFVAGDTSEVRIDVKPQLTISGISDYGIYNDSVTFSPEVNFVPTYVDYELTKLDNNRVTNIRERDPFGSYTWTPGKESEGNYNLRMIAYDKSGKAYESKTYTFTILVERYLSLRGVTKDMVIDRPVTLIGSRNFDVTATQYIIKDLNTEVESVLTTIPYGGYTWFPGEEHSGNKALMVRVKDIYGVTRDSSFIPVNIDGSPRVQLRGVGPNQVLTGEAKLSNNANADFESVNYILTNNSTGTKRIISQGANPKDEIIYKPMTTDGQNVSIIAEALYNGNKIYSESISFRVFMGELYGPKAIIEKDKFLDFASDMAKKSFEKTGMSAALQTAQAILETGWGQSLPVDKYTGKFSYNLFGIKGSSTNGSVTSNTWEVYNGITYRVDAGFRAYNNVQESWDDHKGILLNLDRYKPFRDVMYHSSLGAWAVRRAGYATDPQYPLKLMRIIELYDLKELDRIKI
ncbi:MAG: glucosaminidase domain-containing protein [Dethiosulfatibacter sp.]|nr:glucosaminidase domain-containing protein [Dethiosulfatibacter sp.]